MNFLLSLAAVKSFLLFKGQSWPLPFQYFFSSALSSLFWYPSYTYIRDVMLSHSLCMLLFYFFILLYLCFSVYVISIALPSCSLILSIICVKSADESSEGVLHLCYWRSVKFSSAAQSCPTLCNPMNPSRPGLPVHHQLPEFTQTHVHRVSDAIQPSHPLLSPWVNSLIAT